LLDGTELSLQKSLEELNSFCWSVRFKY
jgi:hypothetical protein